MKETWKEIPKFNGDYLISNLGNVKSLYIANKYGKYKNERFLKCYVGNHGYKVVGIKSKGILLHRLIAEVFIPNPENKPQVNHKDGNKLNNLIENLEWCTQKENIQHAFKSGFHDNATKTLRMKKIRAKKIKQYDLQGNFIREHFGSVEAEKFLKEFGIKVNARNIRSVCEGNRNKAGGFYWEYC